MLRATSSGEAYWPSSRLNPCAATPDRILAAGPHPDRRVRSLRCRRLDHDVVELPVSSAVGERLVRGPRLEDHGKRLVEPRVGFLHRHAKTGELVVAIALADAEIEAATR